MVEETVIRTAEFDSRVCTYWLLSGAVLLTVIVIGIPFLPIWFLIGFFWTKRFLDAMECVLTDKTLKVKKGHLVRVEKTVPLEKITDMGMVQGPIMRQFGLYTLTVETAGQSGPGSLVSLTGIIDAKSFRESVLKQRDALSASSPATASETVVQGQNDAPSVLLEIRDSLLRIEAKLEGPGD